MAKQEKTNQKPQSVPRNNPGGSEIIPKGQVPRMRTPPPPPSKK